MSRRFRLFYDIDDLDNRDPEFVRSFAGTFGALLRKYFKAQVRGLERVPDGPALYVGNHNGGLLTPDTWIFSDAVLNNLGIDSVPYGLGHEWAIRLPIAHQVLVPLGAVRAGHDNALRLFADGKKVLVYPGGDVDAFRPFRHRERVVFGGRTGYIRLALRAGVPIVPVVAAGAHTGFLVIDDLRWLARLIGAKRFFRIGVWPLTLSFPWGLTLGPPPPYVPLPTTILIESLEPIRFDRWGDDAAQDGEYVRRCAAQVEDMMQTALTRLCEERKATV